VSECVASSTNSVVVRTKHVNADVDVYWAAFHPSAGSWQSSTKCSGDSGIANCNAANITDWGTRYTGVTVVVVRYQRPYAGHDGRGWILLLVHILSGAKRSSGLNAYRRRDSPHNGADAQWPTKIIRP
jgi:hypothetical protein